jgi:hypothetical protein
MSGVCLHVKIRTYKFGGPWVSGDKGLEESNPITGTGLCDSMIVPPRANGGVLYPSGEKCNPWMVEKSIETEPVCDRGRETLCISNDIVTICSDEDNRAVKSSNGLKVFEPPFCF